MMQLKDPAIKLFGKTIPFCSDAVDVGGVNAVVSCSENDRGSGSSGGSEIGAEAEKEKEKDEDEVLDVRMDEELEQQGEDEPVNETTKFETDENRKIPSVSDENVKANDRSRDVSKEENVIANTPLKKPDKVLQCPRCESMDTKFCYYNNYNVLQPRHFCKGCQRYWTAGGAMRNVPVGAGRRKSKGSALHNHFLTLSEVIQGSGAGSPNGMVPGHQVLKYGSASTVGSDAAVCVSTGSVSNLKDLSFVDGARNLSHKVNEQVVTKSHEAGDINSSGSCITASSETESKRNSNTYFAPIVNACLSQFSGISAMPMPLPWNAAIPPPASPHPGFAIPLIQPTYWPCAAIPNGWNAPSLTPQSLSQTNTNIGANAISKPPVLGKHSRDSEMLRKDELDKQESAKQVSVLKPKTLRIDHPEEAVKSSIWETLGIKNETVSKGRFLTELKSKDTDKIIRAPENYAHLTSNPAALSRSRNFNELS